MELGLRGKTALITGASRGIGLATAESYAYSRIRNAGGERIQTNQPQNMAKLWTTLRLAQGVPGLEAAQADLSARFGAAFK